MRTLEWDDMGVKIDGRQLHHLRFADDIVLITPSTTQAERMLADFDGPCGKIGVMSKKEGPDTSALFMFTNVCKQMSSNAPAV
ncbi:hypothetical protein Q1695_015193 [Nippostrongylus brasiliensis]|nr:hypothetical protein Q1695_015193 [Nippostrongylus brasiliensis]